jgi:hypothetical protein
MLYWPGAKGKFEENQLCNGHVSVNVEQQVCQPPSFPVPYGFCVPT